MVLAHHVTRRLLDITITKNINKDKVNVRKKRNRLRPFCIRIYNVLKISNEIINKYCRCLPPLSWTSPCWSGGWPSRWTAPWLIGRVSRYVHHCTRGLIGERSTSLLLWYHRIRQHERIVIGHVLTHDRITVDRAGWCGDERVHHLWCWTR